MWVNKPCIPRNESDYSDNFSDLDTDTDDDSKIDPRVQDELERLNNATDAINKLEVELDDARAAFRQLLTESTQRIDTLAKQLGSSVEKARPYYEAKMKVKEAHSETQKAALRFERANSAHSAAKEMVFLAEEGLQKEGRTFDPAWQEMLNHATMRVNESECERNLSEQEHRRTSKNYNDADRLVKDLKKDLKKTITKSRPYFDMKAQFKKVLDEQKKRVQELEEGVLKSKQSYSDALHNLEEISDEIHRRRKRKEERLALGARGPGVGAEDPEPSRKSHVEGDGKPEVTEGANDDEDWSDPPVKLRFPKSLSSSTLSHMTSTQTLEERQNGVEGGNGISRLRKSKSVYVRHDGTGAKNHPLFGRYSISRNFKLQVDHASQTEENESGCDTPLTSEDARLDVESMGSSSVSSTPNLDDELRLFHSLTVDDAYDLTDGGATSSSNRSSLVGSEATSPTVTTDNGLMRDGGLPTFALLSGPLVGEAVADREVVGDYDAAGGDAVPSGFKSSAVAKMPFKDFSIGQIVHRTTQTFPYDVVGAGRAVAAAQLEAPMLVLKSETIQSEPANATDNSTAAVSSSSVSSPDIDVVVSENVAEGNTASVLK